MSGFTYLPGQFPGTATSDSANTGNVGELLTASAATGSVSMVNNTSVNVTSISLTPGDWEVSCSVLFTPAASTTVTSLAGSLSTTTATMNNTVGNLDSKNFPALVLGSVYFTGVTPPLIRVSLSATTTYYLVAFTSFGTSTMTAGGIIHARRVR